MVLAKFRNFMALAKFMEYADLLHLVQEDEQQYGDAQDPDVLDAILSYQMLRGTAKRLKAAPYASFCRTVFTVPASS